MKRRRYTEHWMRTSFPQYNDLISNVVTMAKETWDWVWLLQTTKTWTDKDTFCAYSILYRAHLCRMILCILNANINKSISHYLRFDRVDHQNPKNEGSCFSPGVIWHRNSIESFSLSYNIPSNLILWQLAMRAVPQENCRKRSSIDIFHMRQSEPSVVIGALNSCRSEKFWEEIDRPCRQE